MTSIPEKKILLLIRSFCLKVSRDRKKSVMLSGRRPSYPVYYDDCEDFLPEKGKEVQGPRKSVFLAGRPSYPGTVHYNSNLHNSNRFFTPLGKLSSVITLYNSNSP